MEKYIDVGEVRIQVLFKDIKNINLSVLPPVGGVRISVPESMGMNAIRMYAISKIGWIRKEQEKLKSQKRETQREFINRESHYLWGKRYLLKVQESAHKPAITIEHNTLTLIATPKMTREDKETVMDAFYRQELRSTIPSYIKKYEDLMEVNVENIYIQKMKTKWGSCNHQDKSIRLNSELAKKPRHLTEYVVAHEIAHLIDPTHRTAFTSLMNKVMPAWRQFQDELNNLPLRYEPSYSALESSQGISYA